jgi:hypothetical protein
MRKLSENKRGQFVIIAVLLMAIMIISVAATINRAATYYRHEPWDEYSTLLSNIELGSRRLVELSLANYTKTGDHNVLKNNLDNWQANLTSMYPGYGIALKYTLANGPQSAFGNMVNFNLGLNSSWRKQKSFSVASANFTLDITSIGLNGYKFDVVAYLEMTIRSRAVTSGTLYINVTVADDNQVPMVGLSKDNFLPEGFSYSSYGVTNSYDQSYTLIYTIVCRNVNAPSTVLVNLWDFRGIQVESKYP